MRVGISTYALFWECSDRVENPITVEGMLDRTKELDCNVLQICDYPKIETFDAGRLAAIAAQAKDQGIEIELGTRGTEVAHLKKYLDLCQAVDAKVLRSMIQIGPDKPTLAQTTGYLYAISPVLDELGIDLALETYEQLPTKDLVATIEAVNNKHVGIALDPANCVANLEHPNNVIDACAPYTLNLHVKDFAFSRKDGWVGFTYSGAPMGTGLLDYQYELSKVQPVARGISQIVEHWLSWQEDEKSTISLERQWTELAVTAIKQLTTDHKEN